MIFDIILYLYPFTNQVGCAHSGDFVEIEFMEIYKCILGILLEKIDIFKKSQT